MDREAEDFVMGIPDGRSIATCKHPPATALRRMSALWGSWNGRLLICRAYSVSLSFTLSVGRNGHYTAKYPYRYTKTLILDRLSAGLLQRAGGGGYYGDIFGSHAQRAFQALVLGVEE
jgi:hypothetical protein